MSEADREIERTSSGLSAPAALRALADATEEAERTRQQLNNALESMSEGIVLFDADDRIVICNSHYRRYYQDIMGSEIADMVRPGAVLWDIMRAAHKKGMFPNIPIDSYDDYVAKRREMRRSPGASIEQLLSDGRWLQITEHRTSDGGIASVYTDVTEIKRRSAELSSQTEKLESLSSKLAKYLPPQVFKSIFAGEQSVEIASKRKKLTIFFSDIAGFTDTVDSMESEELTALLNQYFTEMSGIAEAHGATVGKYIGDAILAFFGDPISRGIERDAVACVRMAIAMQRRMVDLRRIWRNRGIEHEFEIRMGIATGYCTVGNFGSEDRLDYTVVGSPVNLAARLQAAAERSGILMDNETGSLVSGEILIEEKGSISVKGFIRPVRVHGVRYIQSADGDDRIIAIQRDGLRLIIDRDRLSADEAIKILDDAIVQLKEANRI